MCFCLFVLMLAVRCFVTFFVNKFIIEMENIAVTVADNIIEKELLLEIITSIINEEDYKEELKLKIINSLEQINPESEHINFGTDFYRDLY